MVWGLVPMSACTLITAPSVRLPTHDTALPVSVHTGASRMPNFFSSSTSVAANFTPVSASPPTGASADELRGAAGEGGDREDGRCSAVDTRRRVMTTATPPPTP